MNSSLLKIETHLKQLLTPEQAHLYRIIPINNTTKSIHFKTDTPETAFVILKNELSIVLGYTVSLEHEKTKIITELLSFNYQQKSGSSTEILHYSDDFLLSIIHQAQEIGSSDIHFEIYEHKCRVRIRIDGKLIEKYIIESNEYAIIVNRIKIMANLDISEKRLPQDGRISLSSKSIDFDIRVSVLPTLYGEKIVLRLLSKDTTSIDLEQLGFSSQELSNYKERLKNPHGIILISGPTGSGKTTTLYATLKILNQKDTNIVTIEDPIEYTLEGVNQVQLKESIGLDFASTLRTFLRQDPDIIMVGEIRDVDTANMAIRAALTGHLVLSTIHTNSAWATISRLIDMGVPSFLIASTLNVSIAQRLVRKLCNHCKEVLVFNKESYPMLAYLEKTVENHFLAQGCTICHYTGYKGRKAIYEILPITNQLADAIKSNRLEIDAYMQEEKIASLKTNAIRLINQGVTSIAEVYALLV